MILTELLLLSSYLIVKLGKLLKLMLNILVKAFVTTKILYGLFELVVVVITLEAPHLIDHMGVR